MGSVGLEVIMGPVTENRVVPVHREMYKSLSFLVYRVPLNTESHRTHVYLYILLSALSNLDETRVGGACFQSRVESMHRLAKSLHSVDLPDPDLPTRPTLVPGSTTTDRLLKRREPAAM